MADDTVRISTPVGDEEVSVDKFPDGTVHERVKLQIGATGTAADVHAGNPVPVVDALVQALVTTLTPVDDVVPGHKKSTSPGAEVEIVTVDTPCKWVIVSALPSNANVVFVSGAGVSAVSGSESGTPLFQYGSVVLPIKNAMDVFFDVVASNDGVSFSIGI